MAHASSLHIYASKGASNLHPDTGSTFASSTDGYVSSDLFVREGDVNVTSYPGDDTLQAYQAVTLGAPKVSVTLYVDSTLQSLETATKLRDALSKAIRAARKSTK